MPIPEDFLKFFLLGGFVPAFLFVVLTDMLIIPRYFAQRFVGLDWFKVPIVIIVSAVLGLLLMALNTPIIKLFEYGLLPWLTRAIGRRRHDKLYSALHHRRQDYQRAQGLADRKVAALKLDGLHQKIERITSSQRLPYDRDHVMPTALGNTLAIAEEYPYHRYGMDAMTYWTRLVAVIPKEYEAKLSEQKTTLDFLLNLSLLSLVFAGMSLGTGLWFSSSQEIVYGVLALVGGCLLYRVGVSSAATLGEVIKSCFDLFRYDLLQRYGLQPQTTIAEERELWMSLANFISRGEDFYYPPKPKKQAPVTALTRPSQESQKS